MFNAMKKILRILMHKSYLNATRKHIHKNSAPAFAFNSEFWNSAGGRVEFSLVLVWFWCGSVWFWLSRAPQPG